MTSDQIERFRERLLRDREVLDERILAAEAEARAPLAQDPLTISERREGSDLGDTVLTVGARFTEQQREVDDALLRMELGEYGICEACGEPIELERLEVQPAARLCEADARRADQRRTPSL